MSDIKVRVGQQNAVRISASVSGVNAYAENANKAVNVIGGIASVTQLHVSGVSTFIGNASFNSNVSINGNLSIAGTVPNFSASNANISGILTVGTALYYPPGEPFGIAYFNQNDLLVSTGSTSTAITETNYILSTNSSGIPTWSNTIDGGVY